MKSVLILEHSFFVKIMKNYILILALFVSLIGCNSEPKLKLESSILGNKNPVFILENGMASTYETWKKIPDSLAKYGKVLIYNRAGLGKSEVAQSKRTIPNMVNDLEELIQSKNLNEPFILVAHSMGSYLSRYYALQHPEKVKGILLIDPSPDTMYDNYSEKETQDFLKFGNDNFKNSSMSVKNEWNNYLDNRKFVQQKISDEIPIIILSATQWNFFEFHKSIVNKNLKSKHIQIEGSHDLHHEKPELILKYAKELMN